ncbi:molybdenum cofactor synthesis domain protein [Methylobacterium sp. 4-46]|uniref:molybdopterin molybdotransferase MoeA n=1 Tax=unclassified Methylobacterium TaxID=2615210 RepID=UPI000165CCB0|nr:MULTISPECIES: gephyrin-like molybdotransferase Glp [Methylobacterium]ACA19708.1 molybdenum cofactor synthesis domain protein [Methylobacterium sp. 4-46]WFT78903.1 molybdopterin molybdotransferase MoeA [Methylobacterium nodulans]
MSALLPVAEALARILAGAAPVAAETVPIGRAAGRTLAEEVRALRTQPPFVTSAMDGYAVRSADLAGAPVTLRLIGTSAAGQGLRGPVGPGEAVRILTGAPMPEGADTVVIQEDAEARGESVRLLVANPPGRHLRGSGLDFRQGDLLLPAGTRLDGQRLALAAAGGHPTLRLRRRPRVAILATGDELVRPGEPAAWDQIVASNGLALAAMAEEAGAEAVDLGIAGDRFADLEAAIGRAREERADLLVTLGGASVGDHDLVQSALVRQGLALGFWRVAIRPGKPLMHGRLGPMAVLGLPGNPVSSVVCGLVFVRPLVRALLGDPEAGADRSEPAILGRDLPENDARQDYMRARLEPGGDGLPRVHPAPRQDSSMLSVLATAEALLVRPPHAPAAKAGEPCRILRLDRAG